MQDWFDLMQVLVAVGLAAGLFLLNAFLFHENKKTPVPKGCENLTPDCGACGIANCGMRGTFEGKEDKNGNR